MKFYDGDVILSRSEAMVLLIDIFGNECFLCKQPPTEKDQLNIDHYFMPYSEARRRGWKESEYNSIENIRPTHESCNRQKQATIVDSHDWVWVPPVKVIKPTKTVKTPVCETCMNGAYLEINEQCPDCLLDNKMRRFPKVLQVQPKSCDHKIFHCWVCVVHPELIRS